MKSLIGTATLSAWVAGCLMGLSELLVMPAAQGASASSEVRLGGRTKGIFAEFIRSEGLPPEDYVVSKFDDHDLLFLGENHYVTQNLEFLQRLIPKLVAAGIYTLGYEWVDSKHQKDLDKLLAAKEFDESLANSLIFDFRPPLPGYVEYVDVLRAAWQVNSKRGSHERTFRIVALDVTFWPTEWSQLRPGEKGSNPAVRNRIMGGDWLDRRDISWALIINREILEKGEKALIYSGSGHSTTRFILHREGRRHYRTVGNLLYSQIGDRAISISLHDSVEGPVSALMEQLMSAAPANLQQVGFDLRPGTPAGDLPSFLQGYLPSMIDGSGRSSNFSLADVTNGYVFLAPAKEFKKVRPIEGVLTPENVKKINEYFRLQAGDRKLTYTRPELERMFENGHN